MQRGVRLAAGRLNSFCRNRLLIFEPEMTGRTGQVCAVAGLVERMIHQETGRMAPRETTVTLVGVDRQGCCTSDGRRASPTVCRGAWPEPGAPDAIAGGRA
jgi:hypothetical protein